jgi:hypothetical protein
MENMIKPNKDVKERIHRGKGHNIQIISGRYYCPICCKFLKSCDVQLNYIDHVR